MTPETRDKIRHSLLRYHERRRQGGDARPRYGDSLRGYGYEVMLRDGFRCVYCGYDGRDFPNWLQLTVDHVVPSHQGGSGDETNLVAVCHACNSITSRMRFADGMVVEEIIEDKKNRVRERRREFWEFWNANVAEDQGPPSRK